MFIAFFFSLKNGVGIETILAGLFVYDLKCELFLVKGSIFCLVAALCVCLYLCNWRSSFHNSAIGLYIMLLFVFLVGQDLEHGWHVL